MWFKDTPYAASVGFFWNWNLMKAQQIEIKYPKSLKVHSVFNTR